MNECAVFLDTNIYLHYKFFDQIPWNEIAGASQATLVVPPVILSEIDKHKYDHRLRRVRDRANLVGRRFDDLNESNNMVRPSVRIQFLAAEPREFNSNNLDSTSNDDRFLASVLEYVSEHRTLPVFIVTDDVLMKVKARSVGVALLSLPEEHRLPPELDSDEIKIRELQTKLSQLQSLSPELTLQFKSGSNICRFQRPTPPSELSLDELYRLEEKYPELWQQPPERLGSLNAFMQLRTPRISDYEIERYNTSRENFFRQYENYLKECHAVDELKSRSLTVNVELGNSGTCPAEEIRISVRIPKCAEVSDDENVLSYPKQPKRPQKPRPSVYPDYSSLIFRPNSTVFNPAALSRAMKPEPVRWLGLSGDDAFIIASFEVLKLNHGFTKPSPRPIIVSFTAREAMQSFTIEYDICAANIPTKQTGKLHVIVDDYVSDAATLRLEEEEEQTMIGEDGG